MSSIDESMPITQTIKILPDFIANQIAAGEVVQRPESIVKELVENSIDAGGDTISIGVRNAGKSLIHISDNGSGMSKEDLLLSVKRHATSKIRSQEDLQRIMTLGFRGEALASISAVANLEIRTKKRNDEHGWKLLMKPGEEPTLSPEKCPDGTQIFVRNMFFNVPARRKFLRSNLTEFKHINDTVTRISLAHTDKRFILIDDDDLVYDLPASDLVQRIRNLIGSAYADSLMKVDYKDETYAIRGYVGKPHLAKKTRSGIYLFLNCRPIQNNALSFAVYSEFEHLIDKAYKPFHILFIEADPERVDINVHPQKHEVKFDDDRLIYNAMKQAVRQTLAENDLTHSMPLENDSSFTPYELKRNDSDKDTDYLLINRQTGEIIEDHVSGNATHRSGGAATARQRKEYYDSETVSNSIDLIYSEAKPSQSQIEHTANVRTLKLSDEYFLIADSESLYVMNLEAAFKRVTYDRLLAILDGKTISKQQLLFPEIINFDARNKSSISSLQKYLGDLGFDFEIHKSKISLFSVPDILSSSQAVNNLKKIITNPETYLENDDRAIIKLISQELTAYVNTGYISKSEQEVVNLYNSLMQSEMSQVSPTGQFTFAKIKLEQLNKKMKAGKLF